MNMVPETGALSGLPSRGATPLVPAAMVGVPVGSRR